MGGPLADSGKGVGFSAISERADSETAKAKIGRRRRVRSCTRLSRGGGSYGSPGGHGTPMRRRLARYSGDSRNESIALATGVGSSSGERSGLSNR